VIPGVNDDEGTMRAAARIAVHAAARRVSLLPFHRTADGKRARLGRRGAMAGVEPPTEARLRELAGIVERAGVAVSLGG
jgi:pyruvate formate lyase activating enzyme